MSNILQANWYLHHGPVPQQHIEAATIMPAILSSDCRAVYSRDITISACSISLFLPIFSCSQISLLSISLVHAQYICLFLLVKKLQNSPLQRIIFCLHNSFILTLPNQAHWQTSPGLTEHKCWADSSVQSSQSYFQSFPNFSLSSTWLVSTFGFFVQLPPNTRAFSMFLFKHVEQDPQLPAAWKHFLRHPSGSKDQAPSTHSSSGHSSTNSVSSSQPL